MTVRAVAAPSRADLDAAAAVVAAHLAPTPLIPAPALGDGVHLKLETLQPTGSFKVRGGLAALTRAGAGAPVVTASAGNAGLGIAWAASTAVTRASTRPAAQSPSPEASEPPPSGTATSTGPGSCASSSRPSVAWPAITPVSL